MFFVETRQPVRWPEAPCAQCGSPDTEMYASRMVKTEAVATPTWTGIGVGGDEKTLQVSIPLCKSCAPTRNRLRPTLPQYVVVWFGLSLFGALGFAFAAVATGIEMLQGVTLASPVWSIVLMLMWYRSRRPPPNAASYYQPIWLRISEPDRIIFGFASETYGGAFVEANEGVRWAHRVRQRQLTR